MALMWNRTVEWDEGDWRQFAACRSTEPDLFFPIGTTGPAVDQIESAKRVCRACDVQDTCLDFARPADPLGRLDLVDGGAGGADGEEQIGLRAPAGCELPPVTFVPFDRAIPHEGHADSSTSSVRTTLL